MRDLRIVFMGTPDFAVTILKHLVDSKSYIVGVITAPDKPAGRGRKIHQSAVKEYAISQELTYFTTYKFKKRRFYKELKHLKANLQIVVAFRMLPKKFGKCLHYGTFNLHASLLPEYQRSSTNTLGYYKW